MIHKKNPGAWRVGSPTSATPSASKTVTKGQRALTWAWQTQVDSALWSPPSSRPPTIQHCLQNTLHRGSTFPASLHNCMHNCPCPCMSDSW